MAVNYAFDVNDAVNINPELDRPVGYLTTANFFGDALSADLEVSNPLTGALMPVAAIMSNIQWGQTASANLSMQAYVSMENWSRLRAMTQMALTNTALTLNFIVYSYDFEQRVYFSAFTPQQPPLHAVLALSGGKPQFTIASSPVQLKGIVPIYEFSLVAAPPPNQMQYLKVAVSPSNVAVAPWGR